MLFVDVLEDYKSYLIDLRQNSKNIENHILGLDIFIKWLEERYELTISFGEIKLEDIKHFLLKVNEKSEYKDTDIKQISNNIKKIFSYAYNNGICTLDIASKIENIESEVILQRMKNLILKKEINSTDIDDKRNNQLEIDKLNKEIIMMSKVTEYHSENLMAKKLNDMFHIDDTQDKGISLAIGAMEAFSLGIAAQSMLPQNKQVQDIYTVLYNIELLKKIGYDISIMKYPVLDIEKNQEGHDTIRYVNEKGKKIYLHSKYNMRREWRLIEKNLVVGKKDAIYIVYGLGLGHHIKELKKKISDRSVIFVIEKNLNIVSTFMNTQDFSEILDDNVFFFFGNDEEILTRIDDVILRFEIMPLFVNLYNVIMPAYRNIYEDWITKIQEKIFNIIRHKYFIIGNDMEDTVIGIKNNFENLDELIKSPNIENLKNVYENIPLIIVSAGPSLDKNIHELKAAEGKSIIIATDAVLSTLGKNNIIPDGVVSIERVWATYEKFYKDKEIDLKTVFIGPPVVRKEIFETMKKNKKVFLLKEGEKINEWINNDILKENRLINMGTSCAHIAFSFAKYMGANPIVFIGQDLAYTKEGITHSKEVEIKKQVDTNNSQGICYVKGIDGDLVPTSPTFKYFLTWFELEIAKDKNIRNYIDATEGGAYIEGTTIMTLKEVIEKYCSQNVISLFKKIPEANNDIEKYKRAITEVSKLYKVFNEIKKEANRQIWSLGQLENKIVRNEKQLLKEDIEKICVEINKGYIVETLILSNGISRTLFQGPLMMAIMNIKNLGEIIDINTTKEYIVIHKKMIASFIAGCYSVLDVLLKIQKTLESKMQGGIENE